MFSKSTAKLGKKIQLPAHMCPFFTYYSPSWLLVLLRLPCLCKNNAFYFTHSLLFDKCQVNVSLCSHYGLEFLPIFADKNSKHYVMRKIIAFVLGLLLVSNLFVVYCQNDGKDLPAVIKKLLQYSEFETYQDSMFGFSVDYPSCFEVEPDSLNDYRNYFKASLWITDVHIVQQCYATLNVPVVDNKTYAVPEPMGKGKISIPNVRYTPCSDTIIVTRELQDSDHRVYICHAKMVRNRKTWFVQSLTYPKGYDSIVKPVLKRIDTWTVWNENIR